MHKIREKRTSTLLKEICDSLTDDEVSLNDFIQRFGERGFGLGILLFALPNMIPLGIPVISTISAIPIIIFSIQLIFGMQKIKLPRFIAEKKFKERHFEKVIKTTVPFLKTVEVFIKPRANFFTSDLFEKISGLAILVMALILFLPIPGANFIPAICIGVIALGLLERDGLMVIFGILSSVIVTYALWKIIYKVFVFGWEWAFKQEEASSF